MPVAISAMKSAMTDFTVQVGDDAVKGTCRPGEFTPELEHLISEGDGDAPAEERLLSAFTKVVASWDVVDKPGGKPYPLTVDALRVVPSSLLVAVMKAVAETANPNARSSGSFS